MVGNALNYPPVLAVSHSTDSFLISSWVMFVQSTAVSNV